MALAVYLMWCIDRSALRRTHKSAVVRCYSCIALSVQVIALIKLRVGVGNATSQKDLSKPWPRSLSLKCIYNQHLSYSKTYTQFTTFCHNLLVFHTCLAFACASYCSVFLPEVHTHTHTQHILCVKTLTPLLDRKSCSDYDRCPCLWAFSGWSSADPKRGPGNFNGGHNTSPLHGEEKWEIEKRDSQHKWEVKIKVYFLCVFFKRKKVEGSG